MLWWLHFVVAAHRGESQTSNKHGAFVFLFSFFVSGYVPPPDGGAQPVVGLAALPPSLEEAEDDGLLADIVALPGAVLLARQMLFVETSPMSLGSYMHASFPTVPVNSTLPKIDTHFPPSLQCTPFIIHASITLLYYEGGTAQ